MNLPVLITFFSALAFAGLADAGEVYEEHEVKMAIAVVDDNSNGGEPTRIEINSDDLDFDIFEMQEGETKSIVDENGRSILITRAADGLNLNIDGKDIEVPLFGEAGEYEHDVVKHKIVKHEMHGGPDSTMIISAKPIDEVTQQAIQQLLESAGYDSGVEFIDHGGNGEKQIQIKKVERRVESPQT
ncbi:MAG: hypothetical protein AAF351_15840 [Pseudomonadota bacterium]